MDFFVIRERATKKDMKEIYPKFIIKKSNDLMIRGGDFYAVWIEEKGLWSTDEQDALRLIDKELDAYAEKLRNSDEDGVRVLHMWDAESGMIDVWHKYCQRQLRDNYVMLDEKLIFSNMETKKEDYASKRLNYPLKEGSIDAYERLMSTLYSEEERRKIEWAIGSIVSGDSKTIQKFMVIYGDVGTGKSTVINIIEKLFDGYCVVFDAKSLGDPNNSFALEAFRSNPLVALQHDGDMSKIEDNTRISSLVSHELMTVNEKFKSVYSNRFKCFLIIGTNKPVRITDAKSGLIRRLIDVKPSGNKLVQEEYYRCVKQVEFELGAIAFHCLNVYEDNKDLYDDYISTVMLGASNDFYNFVEDSYYIFEKNDSTTLKAAWELYKTYCEDAKVLRSMSMRTFREELKNYFYDFSERYFMDDGSRVRNYYSGFRIEKFLQNRSSQKVDCAEQSCGSDTLGRNLPAAWKTLGAGACPLDDMLADCPAQYAGDNGKPTLKWDEVKTTLSDLDTTKLHYVRLPENHIVIDFDITDKSADKNKFIDVDNGESSDKSIDKNIEAASQFPPTYAEVSKSGKGIHLHYIYDGDVTKLKRLYADQIEVKVFAGKSSLRRKLTKCNDIPVAHISSGLPLKEDEKTIDVKQIKSEKALRSLIARNLRKEIHPGTKPSMDFIKKILDDAYESGLRYDISDMRSSIMAFAANSTHQADYCLKLLNELHYKSGDAPGGKLRQTSLLTKGIAAVDTYCDPDHTEAPAETKEEGIIFFDIEVFPNLFLVNWKFAGEGKKVVRMINPTSVEIEELMRYKLIGFNCRRYDNHILYARLLGYSSEQLYELSQRLISGDRTALFGEAYRVSYTDVYDFSSKKQSLKKFEIELGIHHQELGLPWDKPVPQNLWEKVAEYCDNDVIATEAVFNARKADFTARCILADVAGKTVNDTTNSLTTAIIFGSVPLHPIRTQGLKNREETNLRPTVFDKQSIFNYRFMGGQEPCSNDGYTVFDENGRPVFPGYKFENGKSTYRGEEVGEGGYVYSEPGIYENVALLDIASMHPSSIVAENLFGDEYTKRFKDIMDARIAIKHKEFDRAKTMLGGKLAKYLDDESAAKDLAQALKIAINSVYGLTSAKFDNPFRDIRNKDNIVAKRGALFMINLKHEVQKRGFTVAHIKTDSIKIPNATPEIISFVTEYGKLYGYNFEHEATYEKMCLVNDAVYVARVAPGDSPHQKTVCAEISCVSDKLGRNLPAGACLPRRWTATGTQFQVPYVFKTLFSHEPIEFKDMCETKSVTSSALYLDMNEGMPEGKHKCVFVGRVGSFCPIKSGCGGGLLYRKKDGKFYAVSGSKGYRWLEAEMVKALGREDDIDESYYISLVNAAKETISKFGDFESFIS